MQLVFLIAVPLTLSLAGYVDGPAGFADPATALPVPIYLWADSPERAFVAKTGAAILVLLAILVTTNALAVFLCRRFERRWQQAQTC